MALTAMNQFSLTHKKRLLQLYSSRFRITALHYFASAIESLLIGLYYFNQSFSPSPLYSERI